MRSDIQASIQNSHPIEQPRTSWRAQIPAYIHAPSLPSQPLQPWDIPGRSPRLLSAPRGVAANDEVLAHRPPFGKASFEWDMLKVGMTARAKQKEDYDQQGNAIDSNTTLMRCLRMGLPIEDVRRLDIHRTGSVRTGSRSSAASY